jgi:hypothetical protein
MGAWRFAARVVGQCMGSKMMEQANTHPTPLAENMDWHQKIAFADAGSVKERSTMRLLH